MEHTVRAEWTIKHTSQLAQLVAEMVLLQKQLDVVSTNVLGLVSEVLNGNPQSSWSQGDLFE